MHVGLLTVAVTIAGWAGLSGADTPAQAAAPAIASLVGPGEGAAVGAAGRLPATVVLHHKRRKPKAPAPAPQSTAPVVDPASWQADMLAKVNGVRAQENLGPLVLCSTLVSAAQAHSDDQARTANMSHNGSDGSTMTDRLNRSGYLPAPGGWTIAENVAWNYASVDAVLNGWMNSPGHRANLMNASLAHVGFGLTDNGGGPYWTQNFGTGGTC
jgi:uncharacterized protein YkwD